MIDQIKNTFKEIGVNNALVNFGMVQTVERTTFETIKKPQSLLLPDLRNHHGLAASKPKKI
ncbi:MAG: hypothetical protein ACLT90_12815 [Enterococcus raffinosus]